MAQQGFKIKYHFAVDTGMRRIGLNADLTDKCEKVIRKYAASLHLTGLFTHLCVADTENEEVRRFTSNQIDKFKEIAESVKDLHLPYIHYMNSAGGLWHQKDKSNISALCIFSINHTRREHLGDQNCSIIETWCEQARPRYLKYAQRKTYTGERIYS